MDENKESLKLNFSWGSNQNKTKLPTVFALYKTNIYLNILKLIYMCLVRLNLNKS